MLRPRPRRSVFSTAVHRYVVLCIAPDFRCPLCIWRRCQQQRELSCCGSGWAAAAAPAAVAGGEDVPYGGVQEGPAGSQRSYDRFARPLALLPVFYLIYYVARYKFMSTEQIHADYEAEEPMTEQGQANKAAEEAAAAAKAAGKANAV